MGSSGHDITVLEELEGTVAIRRRPGMYMGNVDSPAVHSLMLEQALCSALDEAMHGTCQRIQVTLHADRSVEVEDDGRGLPLMPTRWGVPLAEIVLRLLPHACRVERSITDWTKGFRCGGLVVVNALSEWLELEIRREGQLWRQRYEFGKPQGSLAPVEASDRTGTRVRYRVDPALLPAPFRVKKLQDCIARLAAEVPNVSLAFRVADRK